MAATWAKPLRLYSQPWEPRRTEGHTRTYYAQIARIAYPEMDMGRELLRLNLGIIPGHGDRPYIREIIRS